MCFGSTHVPWRNMSKRTRLPADQKGSSMYKLEDYRRYPVIRCTRCKKPTYRHVKSNAPNVPRGELIS